MHHISRLLTTNWVVVLINVFPLYQQIVGRDVMLSSAKHLLAGYALSTLSLVGFEEILRYTQNDYTWRHCEAWYKPWQSPITNY